MKKSKNTDVIEERIAITNIMFGAGYLEIDKSAKHLIKAFSECERDKRGNRRDDGTTDIDSIDSFEYEILDEIPRLMNAVLRQRGYPEKEASDEWETLYKI